MENPPFEDVFPIQDGDFPLLCLFTGGYRVSQIYTNIHLDSLEILLKIQQISTQRPSDFFSENDPCCFKAEVICEDRGIATLGGGHGLTFCQKGIHC